MGCTRIEHISNWITNTGMLSGAILAYNVVSACIILVNLCAVIEASLAPSGHAYHHLMCDPQHMCSHMRMGVRPNLAKHRCTFLFKFDLHNTVTDIARMQLHSSP